MRLPAEWAPQQLVLLAFPLRDGEWEEALDDASEALLVAANAINKVTPTLLVVGDAEHFAAYADRYEGQVIELPTDDSWIRDYGPITVIDNDEKPLLLDFAFDGWGGKYPGPDNDAIPARLHAARFPEVGYQKTDVVLEGGSIESDGLGTILTTTSCLLGPGRNGWDDPERAEPELRKFFGRRADVFWLTDGRIIGDDTDGHVDTLARFLDERTIAYVSCDDENDPHYEELKEMKVDLGDVTTKHNKRFKLLAMPLPPAIHDAAGRRLAATYVNFLISNGHVFVPQYFQHEPADHPGRGADAGAVEILESYGRYTVVPVNCRPFLKQNGSLHCLTMQIPSF